MAKLTPVLVDLIRRPDTNKVMSTISEDGMPHTIVCGTLTVPEEDVIAVGRVWLNRTGRNIQRDPRAEFFVWSGKYAYSILCEFIGNSADEKEVEKMNEGLDKIGLGTSTVWKFRVLAGYDEGISDTMGERIS